MELGPALRLGFLLCCTGMAGGSVSSPEAAPKHPHTDGYRPAAPSDLLQILQTAKKHFMTADYRRAAETCELGLAMSRQSGEKALQIQFLLGLGNCHFAVQEYRPALRRYLEASGGAEQEGDAELAAMIATNISSLYLQLADVNASLEAAERGLRLLRAGSPNRAGPPLLIQTAALHARRNDMRTALRLFAEGIDMADRLGDTARVAFAWDQLGYEWLQRRRLAEAEEAMLEAFRLRKMFRLADLQYSYYTLGMLRSAQGDLRSAARLLDKAVHRANEKPGALPLWRIYYQRGRVRLLQGKLKPALLDLEEFLNHARRIRMEYLTSDSARTSMEGELHDAYSIRITTAARLYFKTGDSAYAKQAFATAEANRAVSLMALMSTPAGWRDRLPAGYWTTLSQVQKCQAELVKSSTAETRNRLRGLLYELTQMEARAGLELPSLAADDPSPASRISRLLRPNEAFFSFHLGEIESYRWTLTRVGLALHRLPPAGRIRGVVHRFREELEKGTPEATAVGEELHTVLFASAPVEAKRKSNWLLALDEALFELPFPALVAGRERNGKPRFLIESHSVRVVPRAAMIGTRSSQAYGGSFVGLADPVYNRADPRWIAAPTERRFRLFTPWADRVLAGSRRPPSLQLARLAGGRTEAERCARVWRSDNRAAVILSGMEASSHDLAAALKGRPSIVHLATHFVKATEPIPQALLALSLNGGGEPELLGPTEVSRWNFPMGLVVLSGCSSGQAAALPGAGLMGMTRAWLAAGAQAVASSLWPTPDDSGEMFVAFYRNLRLLSARPRPGVEAEALRLAQLEMLRSGTWRADPRYWASFSLAGKG